MNCAKCSATLPDGSGFCNHCGAPQQAAPTMPKPTPTAQGPEQEVWKGRVSGWAFSHYWLAYVLFGGAVAYLSLAVLKPDAAWLQWTVLGAVGAPLLPILFKVLVAKMSVRYRLTTQRFFKESGIISRKVSEIELIRIDDVAVQQNLLQRIFNVGTVTVISTDATDPRLLVYGIKDPVTVKEKIRTCVRARRSGAMYMESL